MSRPYEPIARGAQDRAARLESIGDSPFFKGTTPVNVFCLQNTRTMRAPAPVGKMGAR